MCGIAGIVDRGGGPVHPEALRRATLRLRHRGPDDSGYFCARWNDAAFALAHDEDTLPSIRRETPHIGGMRDYSIAFGFRRLAIQDLSEAAHQPMVTPDGRYALVYNGEIYNFVELRRELEAGGWKFRSQSDTEVLLASYAVWGPACLERFNGMWAFAIWDNRSKSLFAARDRFGVKPFYYSWDGKRFVFASEILPLKEWMDLREEDRAVCAFLAHDRLNDTSGTFYRGIEELRGSHCLSLARSGPPQIRRYYRIPVRKTATTGSAEALREIFLDAVKIRMRSDVPLGYALSGGMDSSSVVVAARRFAGPDSGIQNTFSTVYPGRSEDESFYIDAVVRKTGFVSHRVTPEPSGFVRDIDGFVGCHQEPLNNMTYYAQYKLRELEKSTGVTVSLDGHGADEIFGGYDQQVPAWIRAAGLGPLRMLKAMRQAAAFRRVSTGGAIEWMALALAGDEAAEQLFGLRRRVVRDYLEPSVFARCGQVSQEEANGESEEGPFERKLRKDLVSMLIPHQLLRADRSSMAFSLECRFPFLDFRLVEAAFGLPPEIKMREGVSKWVLREAMKQDLPAEIYERKDKKGFPVPERSWLKRELKEWVDSWVYSDAVKKLPWIRWQKFEKRYRRFCASDKDVAWGRHLWSVLSVALWRVKCVEGRNL